MFFFKIQENECKVCDDHFSHLEENKMKSSTTVFYLMYCRYVSVQKCFANSLHDATKKLSSSYRWCQKVHYSAASGDNRIAI